MKLFLDPKNFTVSSQKTEENNFEIEFQFEAKGTRTMKFADDFLIQHCKKLFCPK